jgi:hypothetical protein
MKNLKPILKPIKLDCIYTCPYQHSVTFIFKNRYLLPFSVDLLKEIFTALTKNDNFKKERLQGLEFIKLIQLDGLTPYYFDGDKAEPTYIISKYDEMLHDLIRICNINTFDDYISSIEELGHPSGKIYPQFRIRSWTQKNYEYLKTYHGYTKEGDCVKLLDERMKANRQYYRNGKFHSYK